MCGVIGFVDKKNQLSQQRKKEIAKKMLREIKYRGRDSRGIYNNQSVIFGHNRLAIMDISKKAAQPFISRNKKIVISYNGEIFNHIALRKLTKRNIYNSTSDTETFINHYEKFKDKAFGLIRGMFAVSFYDIKNNEIILSIDQFGIKPLYYINTPDWFAWSSESKVFKFLPNFNFSLNQNKLLEFGLFRNTVGQKTLLNNICKLIPGEFISYNIEKNSIKKKKYKTNIETNTNEIENLLKSSITENMLSDVPVGLQLSGGLDSSLIGVLTKQNFSQKQFHSFSIGLTDSRWNEFIYSKKVSEQIKTNHHEIVFTQKDFCELLPMATFHLDEPISYPNTVPMMILAKKARKYVKVLLSGEGADEIFGGYLRYKKIIREKLTTIKLLRSNSFSSTKEVNKMFILNQKQNMKERIDLIKNIHKYTQTNRLCFYDIKTFLPSLLLRQDKMGMASNLENRFPFLDSRLVFSALKLTDENKFNYTKTKILLKKIASKYLPRDIVYRKKCGFGLPISDWLKDNFGFGRYLNLIINPKNKREYLNYKNISISVKEHLQGEKDNSEILWILITLEIWVKIFIDKEKPDTIWNSI